MKHNDTIRLIGIVLLIYGLQGIAFPLIQAIFKHQVAFEFFQCASWISLIIYICFMIVGICVILFTKPFSKKKKANK